MCFGVCCGESIPVYDFMYNLSNVISLDNISCRHTLENILLYIDRCLNSHYIDNFPNYMITTRKVLSFDI